MHDKFGVEIANFVTLLIECLLGLSRIPAFPTFVTRFSAANFEVRIFPNGFRMPNNHSICPFRWTISMADLWTVEAE